MEVVFGSTPVVVPPHTSNTEITTYMWPGFLGEFNVSTQEFNAWELVGPNVWIPCPNIVAPPLTCIAVETVPTQQWSLQRVQWSLQRGQLWRQIRPPSPTQ